jgi:hypothetical protein
LESNSVVLNVKHYNTLGKSGHRAPHLSFILCADFLWTVGDDLIEPIDDFRVTATPLYQTLQPIVTGPAASRA